MGILGLLVHLVSVTGIWVTGQQAPSDQLTTYYYTACENKTVFDKVINNSTKSLTLKK